MDFIRLSEAKDYSVKVDQSQTNCPCKLVCNVGTTWSTSGDLAFVGSNTGCDVAVTSPEGRGGTLTVAKGGMVTCKGDSRRIAGCAVTAITVTSSTDTTMVGGAPIQFTATPAPEPHCLLNSIWRVIPADLGTISNSGFFTPGSAPGGGTIEAADSTNANVVGSAPVVVLPAPIEMKLEKVGDTVISTDGNYSEDTTIRVTAVHANDGTTDTNFSGVVNIAEDGTGIYTTIEHGVLPPSVTIGVGGTATFVVKSLAGPKVPGLNGVRPDPASIKTTNYPVYQGASLAVEQWIDTGQIHFKSSGPVFDWVEARMRDILDHSTGPRATVVSKISSYSIDNSLDAGASVNPAHQPTLAMKLNPFSIAMRRNEDGKAVCLHPRLRYFTNTVVHEARHAYASSLTVDINNDSDRDFLVVNPVPIAPVDLIIDSSATRAGCHWNGSFTAATYTPVYTSYKGDSMQDTVDAPDNARDVFEEDALTYGASNDN